MKHSERFVDNLQKWISEFVQDAALEMNWYNPFPEPGNLTCFLQFLPFGFYKNGVGWAA